MNRSELLHLSKLFSTSKLDLLANNNIEEIEKLRNELINLNLRVKNINLGNLYKNSYKKLESHYKNELIYKNSLLENLVLKEHKLEDIVVIPEFRVNNSKADLAVFNGVSTVYEIKSDLDTNKRLKTQIQDYGLFFEYINLVTSINNLKEVLKILPSKVGIYVFNDGVIDCYREPKSNLENINHTVLFSSLRKQEYISIIEEYFGYVPEVPNTKIFDECLFLFRKINIIELYPIVLKTIQKRKIQNHQIKFMKKLPKPLRSLAISKKYNQKECTNIIKNLN